MEEFKSYIGCSICAAKFKLSFPFAQFDEIEGLMHDPIWWKVLEHYTFSHFEYVLSPYNELFIFPPDKVPYIVWKGENQGMIQDEYM